MSDYITIPNQITDKSFEMIQTKLTKLILITRLIQRLRKLRSNGQFIPPRILTTSRI
jgi:hypothetical protein